VQIVELPLHKDRTDDTIGVTMTNTGISYVFGLHITLSAFASLVRLSSSRIGVCRGVRHSIGERGADKGWSRIPGPRFFNLEPR